MNIGEEIKSYIFSKETNGALLITGKWGENTFVEEIIDRYRIKCIPEDLQFLLYDFWDLNYDIILKGLYITIDRAYKGDLSCDDLISFLQKIHAMKEYGANLPLEPNYSKMIEGLDHA